MSILKMLSGIFKFLGAVLGLIGIFYLYYLLFKFLFNFYKNLFKPIFLQNPLLQHMYNKQTSFIK
jgi:hypothetical protein